MAESRRTSSCCMVRTRSLASRSATPVRSTLACSSWKAVTRPTGCCSDLIAAAAALLNLSSWRILPPSSTPSVSVTSVMSAKTFFWVAAIAALFIAPKAVMPVVIALFVVVGVTLVVLAGAALLFPPRQRR
ncbi:hypothetical protein D9M71_520810 [compost metagenome]